MTVEHTMIWQRAIGMVGAAVDGDFGPGTLAASMRVIPTPKEHIEDLPWVTEIKAVYGLQEVRDKVRLQAWLKSDGKTLGDPTALPWCGDAVETAVKLALPNEPFVGALATNPYFARNWATFGFAGIGYGAIGVFERGPTSGHVGFLVGEDDTCFHVLGGNQSDSVCVTRIVKGRLIASRWPITWLEQPKPLPRRVAAIPVSVNEF